MRFWVFSRKTRVRVTAFGALTLIAILAIMAATVLLQSPPITQATTPENVPTAVVPVGDEGDANLLGP